MACTSWGEGSTFLETGDHRTLTTKEVDDVKKTLMTLTPATGMSSYDALVHSCTAPWAAEHGIGLSFAGHTSTAVAQVAVAGVSTIDLPGSPPRGAPV